MFFSLIQVTTAYDLSQMAKSDAAMAYDEALRAKNISESTRVDLEALLNNIRDFLQQDGATPADVEAVCFLFFYFSSKCFTPPFTPSFRHRFFR